MVAPAALRQFGTLLIVPGPRGSMRRVREMRLVRPSSLTVCLVIDMRKSMRYTSDCEKRHIARDFDRGASP
jgi:hypothetical protein